MNPITALIGPITNLLGEFIEDKDKANEIAYKIASQAHDLAKGQQDVNKVEAAHRSIFVAGWRPFIGWTCGAALFQHYVMFPWLVSFGMNTPTMDMQGVSSLVTGMLGMGALRSFEKIKGKAK